jgi:hypothetical protein
MTFRFTISRPPLSVDFEAGSAGEGVAILSENLAKLVEAFKAVPSDALDEPAAAPAPEQPTNAAAEPPKGRGRGRPAKNQPDPATAAAPAPAPIPGPAAPAQGIQPPAFVAPAAPRAPVDTSEAPSGMPKFLDRTTQPPAPAPAAPPAPPPAAPVAPPPPPAPVAPPVGVLAPKVIDKVKAYADQAAILDWLSKTGIVAKGCKFDEAIAVLQFKRDDELQDIAAALQVA